MSNARRARGRLMLALARAIVVFGVAALPRLSRAEPRVLIEVPQAPDAVLDEALNRVRGELSAVGLGADVRVQVGEQTEPKLDAGVEGALSLVRDGSLIRIRAYGPLSSTPVVQELDARASDVTAEVVAVRAVEALRAVTVAFRRAEQKPEAKPPAPPPAPKALPPAPPTPPSARPAFAPRGQHGAISVALGPAAFYDVDSRTLGLGGELSAFYGKFPCFGGPSLSSTLYRPLLEVSAGSVDTRRLSAALRVGCSVELPRPFELWFSLGGGAALYSVEGSATNGFVGHALHHTTPFFTAGVGVSVWLSSRLAVYSHLDASWASDAGALRVAGSELAQLERPLLWGALGVALQIPGVL
ncbi:MAG: hypothetical protein QM756_21270 [Polyangiaceae bacterium]